ncbi:MAG: hypothetical protein Kow00117_18010 [Phototrophicales bacterium]
MQPIVYRLEAQYGDQITVEYLNAQTNGEQAFNRLNLPGHPVILIFAGGQEVYRGFGIVEEDVLRAAVEDTLLAHTSSP